MALCPECHTEICGAGIFCSKCGRSLVEGTNDKLNLQLYSTIWEIWRFQVDSYWQRTSYFAVFETAAIAGVWQVLANRPRLALALAGLGIVLTILWLLNNARTHAYVGYWWQALAEIERGAEDIRVR